ncbi:MAG: UDP-3-O-(3-hydroxymyristoyl)glucosamine N-acyltransferase [Candidatus Cloacimonetes bacterium]|jgi:UDP-3-O-[3-hydroxymyristoyl] glucosamine N-acyltransferase|nr:UDP-3-O-(3-hydroxymyristoyl)glucosamine N-acyltransferase [Candidatus Cloacimonadota bacterium]MCK9185163.1 UDP-3-O-(3-hydroxymyristoyl)glucosamine N-acyltransferase [Candidatus Cloacimonadota bacterium]
MKRFSQSLDQAAIIKIIPALWQGDTSIELNSVCEPHEADGASIIFCEQERLLESIKASSAGLIITNAAFVDRLGDRPLLIVEKPYLSFMTLVAYWQGLEAGDQEYKIHPSAIIDPSVCFEGEASIGAYVCIGANAVLGNGVRIAEGCSVAANVAIGSGTHLFPRVTIYESCQIGKNSIIHSGVVIGADGFGYQVFGGKQQKIPQVGNVIIGDEVEIGPNTTIDRATLGSTVIGNGTKIDNLVQIGHNCEIGQHSILCAQVGLAGSTIVGDFVYLAGQVGAAGHIKIGSQAMVGAQSGVASDVPEKARYFGSPATDANQAKRLIVAQKHLPDMLRAYQKSLKDKNND